jgi:hypothetical protein
MIGRGQHGGHDDTLFTFARCIAQMLNGAAAIVFATTAEVVEMVWLTKQSVTFPHRRAGDSQLMLTGLSEQAGC